jgi:hypothetical protein
MDIINLSTENFKKIITVNTKPKLNINDNEFLPTSINPSRIMKDQTTSTFIDTFFEHQILPIPPPGAAIPQANIENNIRTDARNLFLMYVYNIFKLNIEAYFNIYLMENSEDILEQEEFIDFLFKGGNIMFLVVHQELQRRYGANYNDTLLLPANDNLRNFINDNFKVSDFDFCAYIKCGNEKKYVNVKKRLTEFLLKHLGDVNLFFNNHLSNVINQPPPAGITPIFNNRQFVPPAPGLAPVPPVPPFAMPAAVGIPPNGLFANKCNIPPVILNINSFIENRMNATQRNNIGFFFETINNLLSTFYNNNIFDLLIKQIINLELNNFFDANFNIANVNIIQ